MQLKLDQKRVPNHAYYLHHLGLSNWQLRVADLEQNIQIEAQYCLLPKSSKIIFVIASPVDVASQLEQFLISVACSLGLNGSEFGYLIFNVEQNNNQDLVLSPLNSFIKNNAEKIVLIAQPSTISKFKENITQDVNLSILNLTDQSILKSALIKKNLMKILING